MLEKDSDMPPQNTFPAINVRERKRRSNRRKLALVYLSFYTPNFLIPISSPSECFHFTGVTELAEYTEKPREALSNRAEIGSAVCGAIAAFHIRKRFRTLCHLKWVIFW